jgi:hypothetical protein
MSRERDRVAKSPMAAAWQAAATDLGIRFDSPFGVAFRGRTTWCAGWLPGFGCPAGAVIVGRESPDAIFEAAAAAGYYTSALSPYHYETYQRELFMETLNDWGWFARPADAPAWFAGGFNRHGGPL